MRSRLRARFSPELESDSWLTRIRENFRQLFRSVGLSPSSANGAAIHLLRLERTSRSRKAQTASCFTHVAIVAAILLVASQPGPIAPRPHAPRGPSIERLTFAPAGPLAFGQKPSIGRDSGGGEENPVPATHGFFPAHSSVPLAPPRLPDQADHVLPVPTAVLDSAAPLIVVSVSELGLPSMPKDTNSAGPGHRHGIGSGENGGMGDEDGPGAGEGDQTGSVMRALSQPTCTYCPYPVYTDEARHVKVQGTVTLRVLVGTDGRAADIRILRGVGYGLEERAVQTIRGWKFNPAQDANHRTVPAWVTIEAIFRLF
jgi:periplasmic protein TonB